MLQCVAVAVFCVLLSVIRGVLIFQSTLRSGQKNPENIPEVSRSVISQFFSKASYRILLKFSMKLGGLKDQQLIEQNFSEELIFEKKPKFSFK